MANWLLKKNIFVICKYTIIGIVINIPNIMLSHFQNAQYFIHDLELMQRMIAKGTSWYGTSLPAPHLNNCKGPTSLEEARKPAAVISVASDNSGSECNNKIVT